MDREATLRPFLSGQFEIIRRNTGTIVRGLVRDIEIKAGTLIVISRWEARSTIPPGRWMYGGHGVVHEFILGRHTKSHVPGGFRFVIDDGPAIEFSTRLTLDPSRVEGFVEHTEVPNILGTFT